MRVARPRHAGFVEPARIDARASMAAMGMPTMPGPTTAILPMGQT